MINEEEVNEEEITSSLEFSDMTGKEEREIIRNYLL